MVNHYYYYYNYIFLLIWEFFAPSLADDFPMESEWQQVTPSLQNSTQYSGRSQICCSLVGLHSFSYFDVLQSLYQTFVDCTECTNYNWYHCRFHVPLLFQFSFKALVFIPLFAFLQFYSVVSRNGKILYSAGSLFCWLSSSLVVWPRLDDPFTSQNHREVCFSHFPGWIRGFSYTIYSNGQI